MDRALIGQLIGAIRAVWFEDATLGSSRRVAIEIETKAGRHAHLVEAPDARGIQLRAGPFMPGGANDAETRRLSRRWRDLTERVPAAFDGRPRIASIEPVELSAGAPDAPTAAAWWIVLDNGARLHCRSSAGQMLIDA